MSSPKSYVSMSEYSGYVSFPWAAHIHGEDSDPRACWPLPKGAKHGKHCPSVSSLSSLDTYVSSKKPSARKGQLSVLKQHTPVVSKMDASAHLQVILERDAAAQVPFIKDTLPAFATSVKTAVLAAIPFRKEPEPLPRGYATLLYLWDEARMGFED